MTVWHVCILDAEVGEQSLIAVTLLVKFDRDLVDNLIATPSRILDLIFSAEPWCLTKRAVSSAATPPTEKPATNPGANPCAKMASAYRAASSGTEATVLPGGGCSI